MKKGLFTFTSLILVLFISSAATAQDCCVPADANTDLTIDALDVPHFAAVLLDPGGAEAQSFCSSDLNADGAVDGEDITDFVQALLNPDTVLFDFGPVREDPEAEQIALETLGFSGSLLPSDDLYDLVVQDQALIRASEPFGEFLVNESHSPAWIPNRMIVRIFQGQPRDQYNCLNAFYRVIDETFLVTLGNADWFVVTFPGNLNIRALGMIYQQAPEVELTHPDFIVGRSNAWELTESLLGGYIWNIDDGSFDCEDGCDCHIRYVFESDGEGEVNMLDATTEGGGVCVFPF
ncbi:MAG: hypothetical protein MI923_25105 [Phycisphaerales bacterium]|nr:hypothetical protein [Phycisphaerales bacterium]